ncbi:MAG: adenylyl-sulfate kinase [Methylococcaceae bacterium]
MTSVLSQKEHIVWHQPTITREHRERQNKHKSVIIWFTGLSGSGKSTLAHAVEAYLHQQGHKTFVLDGDNIRHGLCADLGFSDQDRQENIRRIGETAKLMLDAGIITLSAFISPFAKDRAIVRHLMPAGDFIEIYCYCPLAVCETRDVKGLYKKARQGEIKQFTGISSPYEAPEQPELTLDTSRLSVEESIACIVELLNARAVLRTADITE